MVDHFDIRASKAIGVSSGAFPAVVYAARLDGVDLGIPTNAEGLRNLLIEIRKALGIDFLEEPQNGHRRLDVVGYLTQKVLHASHKNARFVQSEFGESFADSKSYRTYLDKRFNGLALRDIPRFGTFATNYETGESVYLDAQKAPDELVSLALAKTTALPRFLPPVRDGKGTWTDGGFHGVPIGLQGDLIVMSLLSYYIRKMPHASFKGLYGKVEQHMKDHEIMERRIINYAVKDLTRHIPEKVANYQSSDGGDPDGRILLILPDLSHVRLLHFFKGIEDLEELGRVTTKLSLERFLDPHRVDMYYNPSRFLESLYRGVKTSPIVGMHQ